MLKRNLVLILLSAAMLSSWTASAAVVTTNVNCPTDSLQAALNGLDRSAENVVNVTGVCSESVLIQGFQDLMIRGSGGATIHPPMIPVTNPLPGGPTMQPSAMALNVRWGSNVRLCGLTLEGARTGLAVFASRVEAGNYCAEGDRYLRVRDGESGITVVDGGAFLSNAYDGLVVENNEFGGIYVNASRLHLQGSYTEAGSRTQIRNNGSSTTAPERVRGGIYVGEGSTAYLYVVDVVDNQGWGISALMGSVVHVYQNNIARNTGWGMKLSNNSTGQIVAPWIADYPGDAPEPAPITQNAGGGVLVTQGSTLRVQYSPIVSGNTGGNLVCTVGGEAFGTATNIPGIKQDCKSFTAVADD